MKNNTTTRAYDPKNKRWYTWSWIIPKNLLELIKQEGLILEKDMKTDKTKNQHEVSGNRVSNIRHID